MPIKAPVTYHPIGVVRSAFTQIERPEVIRSFPADLLLEERFIPAVEALQAGQHLIVVTHLHRVESWQELSSRSTDLMPELFKKRMPCRPNPIGVTLVQVVAVNGATITVAGLDTIDGTPILDIKPYKPIYDDPSPQTMTFQEELHPARPAIVLTGGPGGGKSTLIEELRHHPDWTGRFVCLPEAIQYARYTNLNPMEKLFQRMVVNLQIGLENGLDRACGPDDARPIVCHRGSLDPLAFWRLRGWPVEEFFDFTGTSLQQHYQRYTAVLHLVTVAEGAAPEYTFWPASHRPEGPAIAIQLDHWLAEAWENHPEYNRIDNSGRDWQAKSREAIKILEKVVKFSR